MINKHHGEVYTQKAHTDVHTDKGVVDVVDEMTYSLPHVRCHI